jgi:hypothetical protein
MIGISVIREKVRALIEDFGFSESETRVKESYNTFTLSESKISSLDSVEVNGTVTTDYSYDSTSNVVTVTKSGFGSGDVIEFFYTYNNYTNSELDKYIKAALVYLSLYSSTYTDYEIDESNDIYPTPENAVIDLICVIASIIIKPNYSRYTMPGGITVHYPKKKDKIEKIQELIREFEFGSGTTGLITVS